MSSMLPSCLPSRLPSRWPIIQAPMAGVSTPELAAAVSEAGGLGSIAMGAADADTARAMIERTRALTARPFNVNVFCHRPPQVDYALEQQWLARLSPLFARFDASPPSALETLYQSFNEDEAMQAMLCALRPAVVSFHFGLPDEHVIAALKAQHITLMACATTLDEALRCEAAGIDIVVAQGVEAGGHRGVFEPERGDAMSSTLALVRLLMTRVSCPIMAAGGIMDGRAIDAMLMAGASGVQMGTAFIGCPESSASPTHRAWLASDPSPETRVTSVISGRPARALINGLMLEIEEKEVPDYPRPYLAGKALASAARQAGSNTFEVCWAGQGVASSRALPAAELLSMLCQESRLLSAMGKER